jgi:hypothetical protein
MYITWKYDLFPYELCGKVVELRKDGTYAVEGYDGMRFEAKRKIKHDKTGLAVKEMLQKASENYRAERASLEKTHRNLIALQMAQYTGIK